MKESTHVLPVTEHSQRRCQDGGYLLIFFGDAYVKENDSPTSSAINFERFQKMQKDIFLNTALPDIPRSSSREYMDSEDPIIAMVDY